MSVTARSEASLLHELLLVVNDKWHVALQIYVTSKTLPRQVILKP